MNFHPRIEDADEKQLYQWIQDTDPRFGSLASDELTRRQGVRLESSNNKLQRVMLFLTGITTLIAVYPAVIFTLKWLVVKVEGMPPLPQLLNLENVNAVSAVVSLAIAFFMVFVSALTDKRKKSNDA